MTVTVILLCVVCRNMGVCYIMLSQLDAAEDKLSQALRIRNGILPPEHDSISHSETIGTETAVVLNN